MCGRFALYSPASRIAELFRVTVPTDAFAPRYNVAPTDDVVIVIDDRDGVRRMGAVRWGLIPWFQATSPPKGAPLINARVETVNTKPAFRDAFKRKRCIVPADAFFEWKREGKARIPYMFRRKDGELLALAGIWGSYTDPSGTRVGSCAVLTTDANDVVAPLHDRMPVILDEHYWDSWLAPNDADMGTWRDRLVPYPSDRMESFRVGERVNSVKNDDESLIEPV